MRISMKLSMLSRTGLKTVLALVRVVTGVVPA